jgi:hypothetical protein
MRTRFLFPSLLLIALLALGCGTRPAAEEGAAAEAEGKTTTASAPRASRAATATPAAIVLPEGATLTVRIGQDLGSKISRTGDTFLGTVVEPVEVNGKVAVPAGAVTTGRVVEAQPLGRIKGEARLQVRLENLEINGNRYAIQTGGITRIEEGKGKRSAALIGGGAGAGAIIGGIAGGGKGAAIGAAAGAGAGTAGAVLTGKDDIVLPAESTLSFQLREPVELKR